MAFWWVWGLDAALGLKDMDFGVSFCARPLSFCRKNLTLLLIEHGLSSVIRLTVPCLSFIKSTESPVVIFTVAQMGLGFWFLGFQV